jgi:hypothetical protein
MMSFSKGTPGDDSNLQVPPSGQEKTPGYVKNKIKSNKKGEPLARARKEPWPTSLAKVIKKSISISQLLTERDQAANVRVLREAKSATHRIFDPATKRLIEVPDHKTRLAAITLELAYSEGRPVERQISVSGDYDDLGEMLEMVKNSDEWKRISQQKTVEIPPALPDGAREEGEQAG